MSPPSRSEAPNTAAFTEFDGWIARYFSTAPTEREALTTEGLQLAEVRRTALAALIPTDSKQALDRAVPMAVRQALPPLIVARLEERVNAKGFYGVLGVLPDPQKPALSEPPIRREVRLGERARYTAHTFGARLGQQTTENSLLNGIAIDKLLALDERHLRVLENGERPDPLKPIFTTCPISGRTVKVAPTDDGTLPPIDESTPAVEIGGEVHYLCDGGHIHLVEEELVAAEGASGGPRKPTTNIATTQSTGVRTLLYIRAAFPETRKEPQTETAAYDMMRQVNDFMVENSYGNVYLLSTVTPLIILPRSEAWYKDGGGDEYAVRNDALAQAKLLGYDSQQYDHDVVVYTGGPGTFGGLGYVGSRGIWLKSLTVGVASHELGHNFGLWHANSWNTNGASIIGDGSNLEYGNVFDTMGSANAGDKHFNANHKSLLNWLPQVGFVHRVTTSGLYRIHAFDQPRLDPARRYAIKIDKDTDREYWAEFRQKSFSGNTWVRDGIFLNWSPWASSNMGAQLLDMTPGSPDDRNDAPLVIGRTFSDFESGIHLTPIGKGGTVPESMDVVVNLGTFPGNQAPAVSVAASAVNVGSGIAVNFTATASDPNSDLLSYAWDFGDHTFSNTNSPAVSKSWAPAGDYVVRCVVSDMKGGTASDSVIVRVGSPTTFRISGAITFNGQPLADVRVSNGASGTGYREAFTDSDGTYTITGVEAGSVTLTAALYGYSFAAGFANPVTVGPDFVNANLMAAQTTAVTLTVSDATCSETGPDTGAMRLSRTGSTANALTVKLFPTRGTATRTTDYAIAPNPGFGSLLNATIPAGQSFADLVVTPVNDTTSEGPETVTLELAPGSGYVIAGSQIATLVIEDNDTSVPVVSMLVTDGDASEAGDTAAFLISRTGSTANPLVVRYSVTGTATANSDYSSLGTQITIPAGASSIPLVVTPINDINPEGTETVVVTLAADAAYIVTRTTAQTTGTINILDDDLATITVTATDASAGEGANDTGTFVIARTGSTALALTVNYALGGSAAHGVDYAPLPGVLTIPAGSSVGSVTVVPIDDGLGEPQQTVSLQIRSGTGYVVGNPGLATINLGDNADPPIVTVGVNDGVGGEPSDTGTFRFTTTGTGSGNIVVHYTVTGVAIPDVDYVALPGTVTMGRNATADVTITPLDDTELEGYESVTVTIDPDPSYSTFLDTTATINLADDDQPMVNVSTTIDYFTESSGIGRFWISRSGPTSSPLTVHYALSGTATNGVDYALLPGVVNIPVGSSGAVVNLSPIDDTLAEGTETIILTLTPGAYGIGLGSATQYLPENEFPVTQVQFATATGSGSENVGTVNIPVVLSAPSGSDVTVEYTIGGGTATGGVDYLFTPGLLTFPAGETQRFIPLTIVDDVYEEPSETVMIRLVNANGATLNGSNYTFTITNNDVPPAPQVGFAAISASGAESLSPAPIVVSLSAAQASAVTVHYAVTGGTATVSSDYTLPAGTLTFAPGETAKILPTSIVNDTDLESDETIIVALSNPTGAALGANTQHTYTIIDDDAVTVTITATDPAAGESGNNPGEFTLTRVGNVTNPLTVNLTISGSAINGGDYQAIPATATFAPNVPAVTIPVLPIDDADPEGSETVVVTVDAGAYLIGGTGSASVTIIDDDVNNPPIIGLNKPTVNSISIPSGVGLVLDASATDDGKPLVPGILTSTWAKTNGPGAVEFGDAASASTTATFSADGNYVLRLTASDGEYSTTLDLVVNVGGVSENVGPTPNAGADFGATFPQPAILNGTITDDGHPAPAGLTTTWTKASGPGTATFGNPHALTTAVTFSVPGAYTLRLIGDDGQVATFDDMVVTATAATVTIEATDATAAEQGPNTGTLIVSRTGDTSGALLVLFQTSGSAEDGSDYQNLGGAVMIPVGAASAPIIISPIADHVAEGNETATLTLQSNINYVIGASNAASVKITDHPIDAWRLQRFGAEANNPLIGTESANPDGDLWNNLLEFALAADPLRPDTTGLPSFAIEEADATLTYRRPDFAADLVYGLDRWADPGAWEDVGFTEEILSDNGITRMVKDRVPLNGATHLMLRLRVTRPAQ